MEKIICTNEGCHKEFDKPIEIFDGSLVCPRCLRIIRLERFYVSRYNNDLFERAEMYYGKYLSLATKKNVTKREVKQLDYLLEGAIRHCRDASLEGHPGARVLLGRFWQAGYMEHNRANHYKMAFHYFNNVCSSEDFSMEKGYTRIGSYSKDFGASNASFEQVRKEAARHLLILLAMAKNKLRGAAYDYDTNAAILRGKGLITLEEAKKIKGNSIANAEGVNYKKTVRAAYEATRSKKSCPIFAYFIIPAQDFIALWNSTLKELNRGKVKYLSGVTSCYAPLRGSKRTGLIPGELRFILNDLDRDPDIGGAESVLLYFYNPKPIIPKAYSSYLGKRLGGIARLLYPDGDGMESAENYLKAFLEANPYEDHVFRSEDLYFALKNADREDPESSALNILKDHL